jgi:hypothetical protein
MKHTPATPLPMEGFGRDASDLFKIAVRVAGFDAIDLARECFKRAPNRVTVRVVEESCGLLSRRFNENA